MKLQTQVTKQHKIKQSQDPNDANALDIDSLIQENKELKDRMHRTDAVLKSMHVIGAMMKLYVGF